MVTPSQRREIAKRMRAIKEAKDRGEHKRVIQQRTNELYAYLDREGIIDHYE